jgi:hypothetical protein
MGRDPASFGARKTAFFMNELQDFSFPTQSNRLATCCTLAHASWEGGMDMKRSWNPRLWWGFGLALVAMVSYPFVFARYPITRDFPWATLLLIGLAIFLLATGLTRAFRRPDAYRGKITGSILAGLTVLLAGFFLVEIFYVSKQVPASQGAPKVGETAPDFTLPDSKGNTVTLSALLNSPFAKNGSPSPETASGKTAAVALIFYRGYW